MAGGDSRRAQIGKGFSCSRKDARISALEDELARLREEFDTEKQQPAAEEAQIREREQKEMVEHSVHVRAQLTGLTNLVRDQWGMKEMQSIELRDMVQESYEDMEVDRQAC